MQNLKIRVNSKAESKEAQDLLVKMGYHDRANWNERNPIHESIQAWSDGEFTFSLNHNQVPVGFKEITLPELRAMVNPMKEYLEKHPDGTYSLVLRGDLCKESDILIPEGAECLTKCKDHNGDEWLLFWKGDYKFCVGHDKEWFYFESGVSKYLNDWSGLAKVIWQREQDEPFLTPECTLNDQYAEIEQVRQVEIHGTVKAKPDFNFGAAEASGGMKDNVNHPSHYTQGKVECIDALESATIGKTGIEAVCVANVIKYLWRYEEKNGLEDIKKANFYLNRLIATLENNNG